MGLTSATLSGDTFALTASTENGGALYLNNDNSVSLSSSTFSLVGSLGNGGGIYVDTGVKNLSVTSSTFTADVTSGLGGAIYYGATNGTYTQTNSTFNLNSATSGGSLYINATGDTVTVTGNNFGANDSAHNNNGTDIYANNGTGSKINGATTATTIYTALTTQNTYKANNIPLTSRVVVVASAPPPPPPILYVNASNTNPVQNGLTWATAFTTVDAAVQTATTDGSPSTQIWIEKGTYTPAATLNIPTNVSLYGVLLEQKHL